ncbi:31017_t:CDS:1, partial [Gigaspora margarita]
EPIVFEVLGGEGLYNINYTGCSAGFWVRYMDSEQLVTVGHCGGNATDQHDAFYHLPWGVILIIDQLEQ